MTDLFGGFGKIITCAFVVLACVVAVIVVAPLGGDVYAQWEPLLVKPFSGVLQAVKLGDSVSSLVELIVLVLGAIFVLVVSVIAFFKKGIFHGYRLG